MRKWIRSKLWIYFSFIALVITIIIAALAIAILSTLEYFEILEFFNTYPILRWVLPIIFSSLIGTIISIVVSRYILGPITDLQKAMDKVIDSDFSVQLNENQIVIEVENLYHAFNLMVQELNSIEHFQNDFTSVVSHEFKTPLATIQGYVQLLQTPSLSDENRQAYAQHILSATRKLTTMTENMLKLAKIENQTLALEYNHFRLDEQIRHSLLALQPQWESKRLTLTIDLDSMTYFGNEELLEQVWNNIFENAINYNVEDGQIIIKLYAKNEQIYATIEDTGIGMEEEDLDKIFDRFFQADTSRFSSGNGLGLSIVKRIIDLHHGNIQYQSTKDEGTKVNIMLPLKRSRR